MKKRQRWRSLLVVISLLTSALTVPLGAAAADVQCQVDYTANDWGSGFSANITINNLGPTINGWTLKYSYSGNQKLSQGWSGNWTQSGQNITVTNLSWNGTIATGASVGIGANFTYSGTNAKPTSFFLNGTTCT
jgi:cellulase/cellobiase CelA1